MRQHLLNYINDSNSHSMRGLRILLEYFYALEVLEPLHDVNLHVVSVFGSALRSDFNSRSDIDLLVEFKPRAQVGFLTLSRMERELSRILERPVDLVPKRGLNSKIRKAIFSNVRVLYAA